MAEIWEIYSGDNGDHWRFEVFANWWGGSAFQNANKGALNFFHYQGEVMLRVTYMV